MQSITARARTCLFVAGSLLHAASAVANAEQRIQDEISDVQPWKTAVDSVGTTQTTAESSTRTCKSGDVLDGITFSWCVESSRSTDKTRILYHLHGAGGSERSLFDLSFYQRLKDGWRARNMRPPLVITFSFGPVWTLTDLPSAYVAKHPVLFDFVSKRVIPYLESKNATSNVANTLDASAGATGTTVLRRFVMGSSMGGFNTALLIERRPDLFRKAVLGCPALFTTVDPFSGPAEIDAYATRTGASPKAVAYGLYLLGGDFEGLTAADWERNNPLALATLMSPLSPEILVWYNEADEFGFEEGAAEFASSAALLGARVAGPFSNTSSHCKIDPAIEAAILDFLQ